MGCTTTNTINNNKPSNLNPNSKLSQYKKFQESKNAPKKQTKKDREKMNKEMKEYQKLIKRNRKDLNENGQYMDSESSEDARLLNAKNLKKIKKKRQKLTPSEIEDGINQDLKEEEKRKNRHAFFSKQKKEIPFNHHLSEEKYDPHVTKNYCIGYEEIEEIDNQTNIKGKRRTYKSFRKK